MAATQWQAATSGVFLSRFHFGLLSKKHVSRDAYNTPSFPILPLLPPSRGRWGGGEGPPSLGSQPLNQALSHPVNLKQSGFNSSCLPVPALAVNVEARSGEALRLRPAKTSQDAPEESSAQADTSTHVFIPFSFCFSSFLPYGSLRSGNFWHSTLFYFTVGFGSVCAAHKLRRGPV